MPSSYACGARGEEEHQAPTERLRERVEQAFVEECAAGEQQDARQRVGCRNHDATANAIEERAEQQRAEEIPDRERQDVKADSVRANAVKPLQNQAIREKIAL